MSESGQASRTADLSGAETSSSLAASDERPAEKQRRLIPSWFSIGSDKRSVPLPTTPGANDLTAEAPTGPVEQFQ